AGSTVEPTKVMVSTPAVFTKIKDPAEWSVRSRFPSVMFNDRLWVIGGGDGGIPFTLNDVWSSPDGISWAEATQGSDAMFTACESHGVASFNGRLWVMGGRQNSTGFLSKEIWNSSDGRTWTRAGFADSWGGSDTGNGRCKFGLVRYQPSGDIEKLYLLGGFGGTTNSLQNDVWSSTDGTTWTALENAPWLARESFGCAVFQGKIFIIGGNGQNGCIPDIWSFDGSIWTQVTDGAPWGARKEMKTAVLGDKLFVFGGRDSDGIPRNDLWYTQNGTDWTSVAGGFPGSARIEPGFVTDGFHLFIMGGDNSGTMLNDIWKL
ncbi:MAG TPA: hypothetical protein PKM25_16590, partial [Candidatus Ozemobacteraceae bacterium]|nr:hypothetical protein [Candidatus Ozemobacteraceae bacterium]